MDKVKNKTEFRTKQFTKFHNALMSNAPKDYRPGYFPVISNDKFPDGAEIAKKAGKKSSCCNEPFVYYKFNKSFLKACRICKTKKGSWKLSHAILSFEEAVEWIKKGGNIAINGTDGLINMDIDDPKYVHLLPKTLSTISRSRTGKHGFFWKDPKCKILPVNIPTDYGELRADFQYVLAPGSYVPSESKDELSGFYTVENEQPPSTISFEQLPQFFKDNYNKTNETSVEIKNNPIKLNQKHSALFDLKITDVVSTSKHRDSHPLHGSDTGTNFSITNDLANCWRHNVTLNALQFLVVKSNYMNCQDAGTGHKRGGAGASSVKGDDGAIFHAWKEAKQSNLIPQDDPIPSSALNYIARQHKICSEDLIPGRNSKTMLPRLVYNKAISIVESEY